MFIADVDHAVSKLFKGAGFEIAETEEECDAVVFTGGSDVYPYVYGETPIPGGFYNFKRDLAEIRLFKKLPPSLPKIGICRGGQLFNILCGGSTYQDCDGHIGKDCRHTVKDFATGQTVVLNSIHHQMMIPGENAFVVACTNVSTFKNSAYQKIMYSQALTRAWDDYEVLFYQNFNCLCYQPHPELDNDDAKKYFFSLIEAYLNGQG